MNDKIKNLDFSGYKFSNARPGGRLIHPSYPDKWYDPTCVNLVDDQLVLDVKVDPTEVTYWDGSVFNPYYGVGSACSVDYEFSYGLYTFIAKLPEGKYMYPAIWLSGRESWPPEIDILEGYNTKCRKKYIDWFNYKIETNVHYRLDDGTKFDCKGKECSLWDLKSPTKEFNKYSLFWTNFFIKIYYNDNLVREITDAVVINHFNKSPKMNVLMTMNLNGKTALDNDFSKDKLIIKSFSYLPL